MISPTSNITFLDIPTEIHIEIGEFYNLPELASMRLTSQACKWIADIILRNLWKRLLENPPQGIDISNIIKKAPIVILHLESTSPKHPKHKNVAAKILSYCARKLSKKTTQKETHIPSKVVKVAPIFTNVVKEDMPLCQLKKVATAFTKTFIEDGGSVPQILPIRKVEYDELQNQLDIGFSAIYQKLPVALQNSILNVPTLQLKNNNFRLVNATRMYLNDPHNAGSLNQIKSLNIVAKNLKMLPSPIARFAQLQILNLSENALETLPDAVGALTGLQKLTLSNNQFKTLPVTIGSLTKLQKLTLSNNHLMTLPDEISALTKLQFLDLADNCLQTLPDTIGALTGLQKLTLSNNQLKTLPYAIGALKELYYLDLGNNSFMTFPNAIGALINLHHLDLRNNYLMNLPNTIGNLTKLNTLHLSENQINALPDTIRSLKELQIFNLGINKLRILPDSIKALKKLEILDLSNNKLRTIPDSIETLTKLQKLHLMGNPLIFPPKQGLKLNHYQIMIIASCLKKELSYPSKSPLAKLYQSIVQQKTDSEVKTKFSELASNDKNLAFKMVWIGSGRPQTTDSQWGEHHTFDDMNIFYLSVKETILIKLEDLSQEKKNQVYGRIYELDENRYSWDWKWGEHHALDNLPRLADAMDEIT